MLRKHNAFKETSQLSGKLLKKISVVGEISQLTSQLSGGRGGEEEGDLSCQGNASGDISAVRNIIPLLGKVFIHASSDPV